MLAGEEANCPEDQLGETTAIWPSQPGSDRGFARSRTKLSLVTF